MKKKLLTILLSILMVVTTFTVNVLADTVDDSLSVEDLSMETVSETAIDNLSTDETYTVDLNTDDILDAVEYEVVNNEEVIVEGDNENAINEESDTLELASNWSLLARAMAGRIQLSIHSVFEVKENTPEEGTRTIKLLRDIKATSSDSALIVPKGKKIVLDLNGHVLNRGLISSNGAVTNNDHGSVIEVYGDLKIKDSNAAKLTHKFKASTNDDTKGLWILDENEGTKTVNGGVITGGTGYKRGNEPAYEYGGGIYATKNANLTINGANIVGNYSVYGAGIFVEDSKLTIVNTNISGNYSRNDGGGVYASKSSVFTMSDSTISENRAQMGGGIYNEGATTTITSGIISKNIGTAMSGGIENTYYYPTSKPGKLNLNAASGKEIIITENTSEIAGGVADFADLTLSGKVIIKDNTAIERYPNNLGVCKENFEHLSNDNPVEITGDLTGSNIYVEAMDGNGKLSVGVITKDYKKYNTDADVNTFFHYDGTSASYMFVNGDNELEIKAVPSDENHAISIPSFVNGLITSDVQIAKENDKVTLTVTPNDGYQLKPNTLKINGSTNGITDKGDGKYEFTMPNEVAYVTAEFEKVKAAHNVTAQVQGSHGTAKAEVNNKEVTEALENENVVFTAIPESTTYEFDYWEVVSGGVTLKDNTANPITVTMPDTALTLKAHFKEAPVYGYQVIAEDDGHGTVKVQTGGKDVTPGSLIPKNTIVTLSVTPNEGYVFKGWEIIRGLKAKDIKNNTFKMPSNEVKVKAIFERVYNINLQDDGNGSLIARVEGRSPATIAKAGATVTLIPRAKDGYVFDHYEVVSGDITITNNTFKMPSNNITVKAIFKQAEKNITAKLNQNEFYYSGKANKPKVIIEGAKLKEGKDYKLTYAGVDKNLKNAGDYTVSVQLIGDAAKEYAFINKKGEKVSSCILTYTVKKNVVSVSIKGKTSVEWNGSKQEPNLVVSSKTYKGKIDFTYESFVQENKGGSHNPIIRQECKEPDDYFIKVTLADDKNFELDKDSEILTFKITKRKIDLNKVPFTKNFVYDGKVKTPFTFGHLPLAYYEDDLSLTSRATNAGNYKCGVIITDTDHYEWKDNSGSSSDGIIYKDWSITPKKLNSLKLYKGSNKYYANLGSDAEMFITNLNDYKNVKDYKIIVTSDKSGMDAKEVELDGNQFNLKPGTYFIKVVSKDSNYSNSDVIKVTIKETRKAYTASTLKVTYGTKEYEVVCDFDYIKAFGKDNIRCMTINGVEVNKDYYTLEKGSTIFTYNPAEPMAVGTYTVGFHYENGMHIEGKIVVEPKVNPTPYVAPKTGVN